MFSSLPSLVACAVCMAPGHKTSEAIGYAIMALLIIMVPLFVGVIAFFVKINRHAKAYEKARAAGLSVGGANTLKELA